MLETSTYSPSSGARAIVAKTLGSGLGSDSWLGDLELLTSLPEPYVN